MLFGKMAGTSAIVGATAMGLSAWVPTALGDSLLLGDGQAQYVPIQSIHHDFGSKSMNGYFVEQASACLVVLMVIENSDPDAPPPQSPARIRLVLQPGQMAGLDSEEGRSLNLTCGERAATLLVDVGERDRMMAIQAAAFSADVAKLH